MEPKTMLLFNLLFICLLVRGVVQERTCTQSISFEPKIMDDGIRYDFENLTLVEFEVYIPPNTPYFNETLLRNITYQDNEFRNNLIVPQMNYANAINLAMARIFYSIAPNGYFDFSYSGFKSNIKVDGEDYQYFWPTIQLDFEFRCQSNMDPPFTYPNAFIYKNKVDGSVKRMVLTGDCENFACKKSGYHEIPVN